VTAGTLPGFGAKGKGLHAPSESSAGQIGVSPVQKCIHHKYESVHERDRGGARSGDANRGSRPCRGGAPVSLVQTLCSSLAVELAGANLQSHRAFLAWRKSSFEQRAAVMRGASALLKQNVESYASMITAEMGKPINEARAEVCSSMTALLQLHPRLVGAEVHNRVRVLRRQCSSVPGARADQHGRVITADRQNVASVTSNVLSVAFRVLCRTGCARTVVRDVQPSGRRAHHHALELSILAGQPSTAARPRVRTGAQGASRVRCMRPA
jgi:hypothetical protein